MGTSRAQPSVTLSREKVKVGRAGCISDEKDKCELALVDKQVLRTLIKSTVIRVSSTIF